MGHNLSYDIAKIAKDINVAVSCSNDHSQTVKECWGAKQDLYQLKWLIENALGRCDDFGQIEQQWLKDQEQRRIIKILKDDIQQNKTTQI